MQRKDGLVVRIAIKDETGRVVDEVDAVTMKGLLSLAHDDGLRHVTTVLEQVPSEDNGRVAIVRSRVVTRRGVFTGIGDASPRNVARRILPHIIRMAETRATARALRLAVNIGEVAIEELCDEAAIGLANASDRASAPARSEDIDGENRGDAWEPPRAEDAAPPQRFRGRDTDPTNAAPGDNRAMSDDQRRFLFRLAFDLGETRETARDRVLKALGVERLEWATRPIASRAIDALKHELLTRSPKGGNGKGTHESEVGP
jgi:hypothetical protein